MDFSTLNLHLWILQLCQLTIEYFQGGFYKILAGNEYVESRPVQAGSTTAADDCLKPQPAKTMRPAIPRYAAPVKGS